ncbi:MAG: translation elongation factor Ts [Candidatus Gracilibacteria bacterium]
MAITIDQIKELREMTGVSMTACKKALEESKGDMEKAIEVLRKKGEAQAVDRAGRSTANGVVAVCQKDSKMAIVQLASETDFVSRGNDFMKLANTLAEKLLKGEIKVTDRDVPEVKEAILKMGENIQIVEMKVVTGKNLGHYIHSNKRIGVVVSMKGGSLDLAKDIAMHVAATNPAVLSPDQIGADLVAKEKEIWAEQLKNEGKPAQIVEKIMIGKEKKFREENALIKQQFVKDPEKTIEDLLKAGEATIEEFVRFGF